MALITRPPRNRYVDPHEPPCVESDEETALTRNYAATRQTVEPEPSGESAGPDEGVPASRNPTPKRPPGMNLTAREREALSYPALGRETKYVAEEMGVSGHTTRNHIENLRTKLDASSPPEAVMVAMRLGIIPPE